jgi:hypothetical protein
MKKLCTILLIAFILTACGGENHDDGALRIFQRSDRAEGEDGLYSIEFFMGNVWRVHFTDFNTLVTVPVCPKPNCTHKDENCSAVLRLSGLCVPRIFYYNGSLYYAEITLDLLLDEIELQGTFSYGTNIFKMDAAGSNRTLAAMLGGKFMKREGFVIMGGKLYFIASEEHINDGTGESEHYLYTFNFRSNKFEEIAHIGIAEDVYLGGMFNGDIYANVDSGEKKVLRFDTASGKIVPSELPYLSKFTEDFILYWEDGGIYSKDKANNVTYLDIIGDDFTENFLFDEINVKDNWYYFNILLPIFDNKLHFYRESIGWDLTDNTTFGINTDVFTDYPAGITSMYEGDFILGGLFDDGFNFSRITGEEFKGEAK